MIRCSPLRRFVLLVAVICAWGHAPYSEAAALVGGGSSLPSQAGNGTKFLTTDGSSPSWATLSGGGDAVVANPLSQFAATTSLQLKGVISDETGSGALVFGTSPTLVTPILGTPASVTLTNGTGLPISTGVSGLGTGVGAWLVTPTIANLETALSGANVILATEIDTSAELLAILTDETGTGSAVFANTPTLVTPVIGAATGTSLTATGTLYAFSGTAIPAGGTVGSGFKFSSTSNFGLFFGSGAPTLSAAQGSIYLRSDGLPYYNTNGTTGWTSLGGGSGDALVANPLSQFASTTSLQLLGVLSDETGTGAAVFANTPTLVTPVIGAATGTSLTATGTLYAFSGTAIPAGGTAGSGFKFSSTSNFGTFFGSGVPTLSAAQGSIYLRSDGLPYYNTNGTTGWASLGGGSGDALVANPLSQFAATTSLQLAGVISNETGSGALVFGTSPTLTTPTTTGITTSDGANVTTVNAMGALAIDTTKGVNTKSISADSTFTFSGAPATANTWFAMYLTNSDTNPHAITIPSSFSVGRQATITAFTIPASGQALLTWRYDGTNYKVFGDVPALDNFAGTAAPAVTDDGTKGYAAGSLWLDTTNHHAYQAESVGTGAAVWLQLDGGSGSVSDTAFASSWNGVTTTPPSKNAVYDQLHLLDTDDDGKVDVIDNVSAAGFLPVTSGGVPVQARTLTGTASQISVTNGTGASGDPVFSLPTSATINNFVSGYATTATAAGTTTLTVSSNYAQYFTGVTTQTVVLPVASTLAVGHEFFIVNLSTGLVTVNSSGANAVVVLGANTSAAVKCILASGTSAASWSVDYGAVNVASGKVATINNSITLTGTDGTTITLPSTSATMARTDAANTFTGVQSMTSPDVTTSITTPSTTFALANTTATTVNAFGAATTVNTGASATQIWNFGGSTTASELRFLEPSGSGTNYTALKAGAQAANVTYTWPPAVGGAGTFLKDAAGDGVLSWATPGGSGTVTATGGSLTSNALVLGAGTTDTKVSTGFTTDGTSILTLGVAGASVGTVAMKNATSGTASIIPPTGALGTYSVTLPNAASTLPIFGQQVTFAGPTAARTVTLPDASFTAARTDAANTFTGTQTVGALVATTVNGNTITTGSSTFTGTAGQTYTFPSTTATIARTDAANTFTGVQTMTNAALTTPAFTGLPTGTGVASAATASTLVARDSSANVTNNNVITGYTTTATAAGTTTLTVASTAAQFFTGVTTQTVTLPVASTLTQGQEFFIVNNSTGLVTVNSSGANAVVILAAGTAASVKCILTSGTTAASWSVDYGAMNVATGKVGTLNNTLTFSGTDGTTMTFPTTSATIARTDAANTFTGTQTYSGLISAATGTTGLAPINIPAGTVKTTPAAGDIEFDGVNYYGTIDTTSSRGAFVDEQYFHLTANGSAITTIANFFGATSNPSIVASGYYIIEANMYYVTTGTGTVVFTFTNSAAPTSQNINWLMSPVGGVVAPPGTATMLAGQVLNDNTAAKTITTGSLTAGSHYANVKFMIKNSTGVSFKIQATSNGTNLTPQLGSWWTCRRIAAGNVGTFVN